MKNRTELFKISLWLTEAIHENNEESAKVCMYMLQRRLGDDI